MIESAIDTKSMNIYTKVLQAAEERIDCKMQTRWQRIPDGVLVAIKARCHRTPACLGSLLNKWRISTAHNIERAMDCLIEEFRPGVEYICLKLCMTDIVNFAKK